MCAECKALRERIEAALAWEHAYDCPGFADEPEPKCTCWQRDLRASLAADPSPSEERDCTCPYTDPSTWLSAASCGYGSGYEPGSMQEWDPDCPVHPPSPSEGGAEEREVERNPYLPEKPADGRHIFGDDGRAYRCSRCGVYNRMKHNEPFYKPCEGEWAQSGKMRAAAEERWSAARPAPTEGER